MRQLRWSVAAADDLERIHAHIALDSLDSADRVTQTIYDLCNGLPRFPFIGRPSHRFSGRRELVVSDFPYIVVYRVTESAVEILRIFHGAQNVQ